jgi:hypothetical protein
MAGAGAGWGFAGWAVAGWGVVGWTSCAATAGWAFAGWALAGPATCAQAVNIPIAIMQSQALIPKNGRMMSPLTINNSFERFEW